MRCSRTNTLTHPSSFPVPIGWNNRKPEVKGVWVMWGSRGAHQGSLRTGLEDQRTVTAHEDTKAQRWEATHSKARSRKWQTLDLREAATSLVLRKDFSYNYIVSHSFRQCLLQRDFGRLLRHVF